MRARFVTPWLDGARALGATVLARADGGHANALVARWRLGDGNTLAIALNLDARPAALAAPPDGKIVFETPPRARDALADARLAAHACIAWRSGNVNGVARRGRAVDAKHMPAVKHANGVNGQDGAP
ncbi:malto-oligosyltrehalose trehalohydrolase [Burkholderia pseudomallei]|nr:malto-oligosyltrehalose trehalohydrolase [Burkholderia pseudomallei]CAJ6468859.1 malto-oligosyltrehalose trehalohydrolase [Burkholderia pseudomallei]